jgi:hypothetical protein
MKDFSPHAILRSPLTPDETVEGLIRDSLTSSNGEGPVFLLIDPLPSPTQKDEPSSLGQWLESEDPPDAEKKPEQED